MVAIINRLDLAQALYPLLASSLALLVFAITGTLGGSGFLAIYIAGLVLGNQQVHSSASILRVTTGSPGLRRSACSSCWVSSRRLTISCTSCLRACWLPSCSSSSPVRSPLRCA
jgi:hypothetical protein